MVDPEAIIERELGGLEWCIEFLGEIVDGLTIGELDRKTIVAILTSMRGDIDGIRLARTALKQ